MDMSANKTLPLVPLLFCVGEPVHIQVEEESCTQQNAGEESQLAMIKLQQHTLQITSINLFLIAEVFILGTWLNISFMSCCEDLMDY